MLTADFDYALPEELIAQSPAEPRDASRLMVVDRPRGQILHHSFRDLPSFLRAPDVLVLNDTYVIPARLVGKREQTGGKWEGLFLSEQADGSWEILSRARGTLREGEFVTVGPDLRLLLQRKTDSGHWIVSPQTGAGDKAVPRETALALLERSGQIPLPPYIRKGKAGRSDWTSYQTIFAENPGSIAAPTAGLHFTDAVFRDLAARGISCARVTLHVGAGTFQPIKAAHLDDHAMHSEWAEITAPVVSALHECKRNGGRIVAVGSTAARTIETAARSGVLGPFQGPTNLFIRPGHIFQGIDAMLTNFHLPKSTLLVLVSAFAGIELIRRAYHEAVEQRYRFFSYGDAMLIL